uniref:Uncharacterized protein n=1 Tax=Globisporangium ultimum (strain ATCC 200006 / CBS 805.95 / DAOM BR144) TaxID=431595 RepID=K3X7Q2_GLOUD
MRVDCAETSGNNDHHPITSSLASWTKRLWALWDASQVSHCGAYSVARARALGAYCKVTSLPRVLAVCVLTPLPSLAFVLFLDASIPLAPPRLGWAANGSIWIRCAFTNAVLTFDFFVQARQLLPGLVVARWRIACVAACTGVSFAGVSALLAAL